MIISEANDRNRLNGRPIKDVHPDLKTALRKLGLNDSLDYFEIASGKKRMENVPFPAFEWL